MNSDLEQKEPGAEQVPPTTEKEREEPTEQEVKSTVSKIEETPEFRRALGKSTESLNKQLSLRDSETRAAKAEADRFKAESATRQAQIEVLQTEIEEALAEDPERRQAYISRIKGLERAQKIAEKEAKAEEKDYKAEVKLWQAAMGLKARELADEIPGLNVKELLETCKTEEEMEVKALRFRLAKGEEESKAEKVKTPKIDSGLSSGGVMGLTALAKANEDFSKGLISVKQLREIKESIK